MSELHTLDSFDNLQRPEVVAERYPHIFSKWGLIRECRQAEFNGMKANGAVVKYKNRVYCNVPKLLQWFEERYGRLSA